MKAIALALTLIAVVPAGADGKQVPAKIAAQIKAKCVDRYPDDYSLQRGCIANQSEAYLDVHGDEAPADVTGIPSWVDRADINNAAYLSVARSQCKTDVGDMVERFRSRALASDRRLDAYIVDRAIKAGVAEQAVKAKRSRKGFCAEAKRNLPNFAADLKS